MSRYSLKNRIVYWFEGFWLLVHASFDGLWHLLRGHKISFFHSSDLWIGHLGFIYCHNCPDCEEKETSLVIWGHYWRWLNKITQFICSYLGHTSSFEWETSDNKGSGHYSCDRCLKDLNKETT